MTNDKSFTHYWSDIRFHCPQCGRFISESKVHSKDIIDTSAYYGVDVEWWIDCTRCGSMCLDMVPFSVVRELSMKVGLDD